jgi:nucleoside diphosphate kinase
MLFVTSSSADPKRVGPRQHFVEKQLSNCNQRFARYLSSGCDWAKTLQRPFFKDLVDFMISGPVMIQVLEGEGAILKNRDLMGATDPKKAAPGTIRADFADSIDANAVHGSDAPETAAVEIAYFFPALSVYSR